MICWVACVLGGPWAVSELAWPVFVHRYAISIVIPVTVGLLIFADRFGVGALAGMATLIGAGNALTLLSERVEAPPRPNGIAGIIHHVNQHASENDAVVVIDFPFCPRWKNPVDMAFEYYGLRPELPVSHLKGDLASGTITHADALNDPRNLHLITILGDVDAALNAAGRTDHQSFLFEPYRYYQVRGAPGQAPMIPPG